MAMDNRAKYRRALTSLISTGFLLVAAVSATAQIDPSADKAAAQHGAAFPTVTETSRNNEIDLLKAQVAGQQVELNALKKAVEEQRILISSMLGKKADSATAATVLPAEPATSDARQHDTARSTNTLPIAQEPKKKAAAEQDTASPLTFKIGNAYLTPFGFFDLTAVLRDKNVGSGIATNFGAVPFSNTVNGNLREYQLSAQNVRFGLRLDARVKGIDVLGYLETDFQGFAPGNVSVTSNSDSLRLRLGFVDLRKNKFEILAGQAWTMLTPNRKGLSPLPADVFVGQGLDANNHIGLVWGRSPQFRLIYHAARSITLGWSIEASEQYGGGSGGSGAITLPSALATAYGPQLNTGNNTFGVPNPNQDHIGKIAFDSNIGKRAFHIEVAGLFRRFAFYNPLSDTKFNVIGGGVSAGGNIDLLKNFRLFANGFYSTGGGRYIFGQGPDLMIRGDGSPQLIRSFSTMDGFEYQATPKTMIYAYYGGAYFERAATIDPANGSLVGFGYTGSPANHNRAVQQGTFGVNYTVWRDPNYGAMQFMTQYSYLIRHPWYVAPSHPGSAHLNMLFLTFRYTLPGEPPQK